MKRAAGRRSAGIISIAFVATAIYSADFSWEMDVDPSLPNVLILGDSISIGYTLPVRKLLDGMANVYRPMSGTNTMNCRYTTYSLTYIDSWLALTSKWDVIHCNWGLHDLARITADGDTGSEIPNQVSIENYKDNLQVLVDKMKATGATVIFATTTSFPDGVYPCRLPEDVEPYNAAAREVMARNDVLIDDLHAYTLDHLDEWQRPVDVHFTDTGSMEIGRKVAECIANKLVAMPPPDWAKFVIMGCVGNSADTNGYGNVTYGYRIGKYAVSVTDWAKFYAESGSDKVGSFNEGYTNWVADSGTNAPAVNISFHQAAQYCNWLTTGSAILGAYAISETGTVTGVYRNYRNADGIAYVVPTENEWYKAAFFKPDGSGYSLFSNGEDSAPPQSADGITGFWYTQDVPWAVNIGTAEQNGTHNMMGCLWEWVEDLGGTARGRGSPPATERYTSKKADFESKYTGFRIAVIGQPTQAGLLFVIQTKNR